MPPARTRRARYDTLRAYSIEMAERWCDFGNLVELHVAHHIGCGADYGSASLSFFSASSSLTLMAKVNSLTRI